MVAKGEHRCTKARTALAQQRRDDRPVAAMEAVEESDCENDRMLVGAAAFRKRVLDVQTKTFRGASIVPCISPTPTSIRVTSRTNT